MKKLFPILMITTGLLFLGATYYPIVRDEVWYQLKTLKNQKYELSNSSGEKDSVFARYLTAKTIDLEPVNKDFSIIIEKIGVNAPVTADVSVWDPNEYNEALKIGAAHAASSMYPSSDPGNVYIFAHTSVNFWELGKYATVFNLLRKLEFGDTVHVFYKNQDFEYKVITKEVLKGWDTYPLTRPVIEPILTLQTCDPPGTTINRLIVTAKLEKVN